jgi:LAS superfamily LD-carboxypeptidase LdcB
MRTRIIPGGVAEPMSALNKVKIIENNEPLVDIRINNALLTFPAGAGEPGEMTPFLRQSVVAMLHSAAKNLPDGYRLHVVSAFRSFERQKTGNGKQKTPQ